MGRRFRFTSFLIAPMTFFLGLATAGVLDPLETAVGLEANSESCAAPDLVQPQKYGPGTDVYLARKKRIAEIDGLLASRDELDVKIAEKNGYFCATAAMLRWSSLQTERDLMIELTDGAKPVLPEVCYEEEGYVLSFDKSHRSVSPGLCAFYSSCDDVSAAAS